MRDKVSRRRAFLEEEKKWQEEIELEDKRNGNRKKAEVTESSFEEGENENIGGGGSGRMRGMACGGDGGYKRY